jgi:tRNA threonylcarbamoyladenosine biosynthesis protein TsaB
MRLLAIETTGRAGSVAALHDGNLLAELDLPPHQGSSQSLAVALEGLLATVGWRPKEVQGVAVVAGPGSFTGLRVGVTAAKTFAYAVGAEVIALDTLEVIAVAAPSAIGRLSVAVDAQRGQVVAGDFVRASDGWVHPTGPAGLLDVAAWWAGLSPGSLVAGPVLRQLNERLPGHLVALDPQYWFPRAAAAGRLAARLFAAGQRDDLWSLVPRYSRPSAAEEKWQAKRR